MFSVLQVGKVEDHLVAGFHSPASRTSLALGARTASQVEPMHAAATGEASSQRWRVGPCRSMRFTSLGRRARWRGSTWRSSPRRTSSPWSTPSPRGWEHPSGSWCVPVLHPPYNRGESSPFTNRFDLFEWSESDFSLCKVESSEWLQLLQTVMQLAGAVTDLMDLQVGRKCWELLIFDQDLEIAFAWEVVDFSFEQFLEISLAGQLCHALPRGRLGSHLPGLSFC